MSSVDNGSWGSDPSDDGVGAFCIRAADFEFDKLRVSLAKAPIRTFDHSTFKRLALEPGDIVLEKSGGGEKTPVGRAVVYSHHEKAITSNFAARVRPAADIDSRFLAYLLQHLYASGATERCIKQTTGIQNLDTDAWLSTSAPLLAIGEQRRIVDFLDDRVSRIDRIIAARREQIARAHQRYESQRRSALLGLPASEPVATDLPWARVVGPTHVVRRLAHVAVMGTGHTPSRSNETFWVDCRIPWLTTSDVHKFRRDEIDLIERTEIRVSELGLANSAAVLHPAGTVALSRTASAGFSIMMGTEMATSQDYVTWTCGPELEPQFLLHSLRVMRPFLLGYLAMGSTHKTIYFPELMDLRLPLPTLVEQRAAVDAIRLHGENYRQGETVMKTQTARLIEYKSALITAAVSGELDVTTAGSNIPE